MSANGGFSAADEAAMQRACDLASRGLGHVEPNPPVGAVVLDATGRWVGEGWHERYGAAHAEVVALQQAGAQAVGGTLYVTLEPCNHYGKTPPCTHAVLRSGVRRVVVASVDPNPLMAGQSLRWLRAQGIQVELGLFATSAQRLLHPFCKRMRKQQPWVHAKWAMTWDGKIASRTGQARWISGPAARAWVHQLRGRMDAIVTGIGTVLADDPLLTARPPGPRRAWRIVLDHQARLPLHSQLVQTARDIPVICACSPQADPQRQQQLAQHGVEIWSAFDPLQPASLWSQLLTMLYQRGVTHLLLEAGTRVMGSAFDHGIVDEVHVFVAPKLVGGATAFTPVGGEGKPYISQDHDLLDIHWSAWDNDLLLEGIMRHTQQLWAGLPRSMADLDRLPGQ